MRTMDAKQPRWVLKEAAKHVTSASIRKRIVFEREQIRVLDGAGLAETTA